MERNIQRGFTLPEALITAVIAAGIVATASTSLSTSLSAAQKVAAAEKNMTTAQNLANFLRSEIPLSEIYANHPDWNFQEEILEFRQARPSSRNIAKMITASQSEDASLSFSVVRIVETKN